MGLARAFLLALASIAALSGACGDDGPSHLRVGIVLPATSRDAVEWAASNVNLAGGVSGRELELVFVDPADANAARALAADPSVVAVVGPETSRALFDVAPAFLAAKKPLVSPSATAGDVFRAFGGERSVWRTAESDVAQTQTLLVIARRDGAKRVAMLTSDDSYGQTFRDWFGFFAKELGLEPTALERYTSSLATGCEPYVERALATSPDVLLAVPSDSPTAVCFRRALAGRQVRVLYSDTANDPEVLSALGPLAEGMEGLSGSSDPTSGFDEGYRIRTGQAPPSYAAHAYDALLLIAYGLERTGGRGGDRLGAAIADVVDGRGAPVRWDAPGVASALAALRAGGRPNISGSTGPLEYDDDYYTDPVSSTYGHWRVQGGAYAWVEKLSTAPGRPDGTSSVYRTYATETHAENAPFNGSAPGPRTGLHAFVAATTKGVENFRHQADALAIYAALRGHGVTDDRITLVVADDLGPDVRNEPGGPNLREGVVVDHTLGSLAVEDLLSLLREQPSTEGDDVLVFFSGHGSARGLEHQGLRDGVLGPAALADAIAAMRQAKHFRRMLVAVDACQSGALAGTVVDRGIPNVGFLTSSDAFEGSLATNWDPDRKIWRADQFSYELARAAASGRQRPLLDVYRALYLRVPGSHVTVYNAPIFTPLDTEVFGAFIAP